MKLDVGGDLTTKHRNQYPFWPLWEEEFYISAPNAGVKTRRQRYVVPPMTGQTLHLSTSHFLLISSWVPLLPLFLFGCILFPVSRNFCSPCILTLPYFTFFTIIYNIFFVFVFVLFFNSIPCVLSSRTIT